MQSPNYSEFISTTAALLSAFGTVTMGLVAWLFLRTSLSDRSRSRYNDLERRAELSEMRESYERKIGQLSAQLTATEERWKDVNHLLLSSQNTKSAIVNVDRVPQTKFLKQLGIQSRELEIDPSLVFVLTPFGTEHQATYETIVQTCHRIGLRCVRGDEEKATGDILSHVVRTMVRARFVIANITGRNPNVFYELGIAHALDKSTILISENLEGVPFDVKAKRILTFENNENLSGKLIEMLARALRDTPVDLRSQ